MGLSPNVPELNRRQFCRAGLIVGCASLFHNNQSSHGGEAGEFPFREIVGTCLYGYSRLEEILPEVVKIGAKAIDLWPKVHGNQREQLDELGEEKFAALLKQSDLRLGCITQYLLGPFGLREELKLAQRLGCRTIVTAAEGPKGLKGSELRSGISQFLEKMKPHLAAAGEAGVTIAIENHGNNLIESPDSLKYLAELAPPHLGIAFAPYHLPQDETLLSDLILQVGDKLEMFYAWQHGVGCMQAQPHEQELLQMPGRGRLDFAPLLQSLSKISYKGWTEIFMHPFPRGRAILDTTEEVTQEILRAKKSLIESMKSN